MSKNMDTDYGKGSRARILKMVDAPREKVITEINASLEGFAELTANSCWQPHSCSKKRARLDRDKEERFLPKEQQDTLQKWWFEQPTGETPNWDFTSTARIKGKDGLLLFQAKTYKDEIFISKSRIRGEVSENNHESIRVAIEEANEGLNTAFGNNSSEKFNISIDNHYQLSNRFAWCWKLASMKIPVVLVYLGFLNATEMPKPFNSEREWLECFEGEKTSAVIPYEAWGKTLLINDTPFTPLLGTIDLAL